jgi:hypothetical protein
LLILIGFSKFCWSRRPRSGSRPLSRDLLPTLSTLQIFQKVKFTYVKTGSKPLHAVNLAWRTQQMLEQQ